MNRRYVYRSTPDFVARKLSEVDVCDRPAHRLALDFADMLVGPTSGGNAIRLALAATGLTIAGEPDTPNGRAEEIALRMIEAGERYLGRSR